MTQEDKELLLKDLGGRLPYGTIYDIKIGGVTYVKVSLNSFYYGLIEKNFNATIKNIDNLILSAEKLKNEYKHEKSNHNFFVVTAFYIPNRLQGADLHKR